MHLYVKSSYLHLYSAFHMQQLYSDSRKIKGLRLFWLYISSKKLRGVINHVFRPWSSTINIKIINMYLKELNKIIWECTSTHQEAIPLHQLQLEVLS